MCAKLISGSRDGLDQGKGLVNKGDAFSTAGKMWELRVVALASAQCNFRRRRCGAATNKSRIEPSERANR
jgi:hypothetical protein